MMAEQLYGLRRPHLAWLRGAPELTGLAGHLLASPGHFGGGATGMCVPQCGGAGPPAQAHTLRGGASWVPTRVGVPVKVLRGPALSARGPCGRRPAAEVVAVSLDSRPGAAHGRLRLRAYRGYGPS